MPPMHCTNPWGLELHCAAAVLVAAVFKARASAVRAITALARVVDSEFRQALAEAKALCFHQHTTSPGSVGTIGTP